MYNYVTIKSYKPLNNKQIEVLNILYRFRFGTSELIALIMNQSTIYTRTRLNRLLDQDYIARNYDSSYKLRGIAANYYLTPKAIKLLKNNNKLDQKGLHLLYYNKRASAKFIKHWLDIFRIYLKLMELYKNKLEFFTSTEITNQDQFPRPKLDSYLTINNSNYFLELLDNSMSYTLLKRKVNKHIKHYETEELKGDYPTILLICSTEAIKAMITKYLRYTLDKMGIDELEFLITTKKQLLKQKDNKQTIWRAMMGEDEELFNIAIRGRI